MNGRDVGEDPKDEGDGEDDGSGLAKEDACAVVESHGEGTHRGHAVLGQLEDKGGFAGLED